MRLTLLPTGHIYDAKLRPYRDLLRRRQLLVHQRTSLLLSVKSLYSRTTGAKLSQGEAKALEPETVTEWFDHPADQLIAGHQVKLIQEYNESIRALEKEVETVAGQLPCYQLGGEWSARKGVGPRSSSLIGGHSSPAKD